MAVAGVVGEKDLVIFGCTGRGVDDGIDRNKGGLVLQVAHHAHYQAIAAAGLLHPEAHLQDTDVGVDGGQSIDAAVVETQAVAAAMCVRGVVIDLW